EFCTYPGALEAPHKSGCRGSRMRQADVQVPAPRSSRSLMCCAAALAKQVSAQLRNQSRATGSLVPALCRWGLRCSGTASLGSSGALLVFLGSRSGSRCCLYASALSSEAIENEKRHKEEAET
ncbi:hypothetical protein EV715DRAFT_268682, partial [Schizophyllum commune]